MRMRGPQGSPCGSSWSRMRGLRWNLVGTTRASLDACRAPSGIAERRKDGVVVVTLPSELLLKQGHAGDPARWTLLMAKWGSPRGWVRGDRQWAHGLGRRWSRGEAYMNRKEVACGIRRIFGCAERRLSLSEGYRELRILKLFVSWCSWHVITTRWTEWLVYACLNNSHVAFLTRSNFFQAVRENDAMRKITWSQRRRWAKWKDSRRERRSWWGRFIFSCEMGPVQPRESQYYNYGCQ